MNKKIPFVHSNYPRRKNDHYPTIDSRCIKALLDSILISKNNLIVDCCAPTESGILEYLKSVGYKKLKGLKKSDEKINSQRMMWIVSNPPFKKGIVDKIILQQIYRIYNNEAFGVAMLLKTGFDHAKKYRLLFVDNPYYKGQIKLTFRPVWIKPKKGKKSKSPIHNYVWHIWTMNKSENDFFVRYW